MMKRLLLIALLTLFCASGIARGESDALAYKEDFENGCGDWQARSTGSAAVAVSEAAARAGASSLYITGRQSAWHSAGREFPLTAGATYGVSCYVYQDEAATAEFIFSVEHTVNGQTSYENIVSVTAPRGVWMKLNGTYAAGTYDRFVLYVETRNHPELSFYIDDVEVIEKTSKYPRGLTSLKEVYAQSFDIGCAVVRTEALNREKMDFLSTQFSVITPGNELKPDSVLDIAGCRALAKAGDECGVAVRFDDAKPLLDYAMANGIRLHGHVLVWHSQTPEAFFRRGYDKNGALVDRDTMLKRLENYIRLIMEYTDENYPDVIISWDVVNEAIMDSTGKPRGSKLADPKDGTWWMDTVGEDYVLRAFEYARRYAPDGTLLFYNDYSTPNQPKLSGICALLDALIAEDTIDGYGFQCHYQLQWPSIKDLRAAMEKIIQKGLCLRMSELDITVSKNSEASFQKQAERYEALFSLFREFDNDILCVTTWGTSDDLSWKAKQYPLLFHAGMQPKPAFFALTDGK